MLGRPLAAVLVSCAVAAPAYARDETLARTPPMGLNSWYAYGCGVTEQDVLDNARALVDSDLAKLGYRYVNVDGCWNAKRRTARGYLRGNPATFPSGMAALGRGIHAMGLKFGVYTSAGRTICLHPNPGSYRHFGRDFRTFARWKVDYVKVDWCNPAPEQHLRTAYAGIARAAARSGRRMIVTVSTPGFSEPWKWGQPYGNSWRIAPDVRPRWSSLMSVLDVDAPLWRYAGPSRWNDADILQVGDSNLTLREQRAHFSLWSIVASPLLAGNRLPEMTPAVRAILGNREAIAIDQDRLGRQGRRVRRRNGRELWVKQLAYGGGTCRAVLALNRTGHATRVPADLRKLPGLPHARRFALHDLWTKHDWEAARVALPVGSHGARLVRACPR